jgi:hypothetical protein
LAWLPHKLRLKEFLTLLVLSQIFDVMNLELTIDQLILVLKNEPNDVCFGFVRTKENTLDQFLTCKDALIEEHKKLIKTQSLF